MGIPLPRTDRRDEVDYLHPHLLLRDNRGIVHESQATPEPLKHDIKLLTLGVRLKGNPSPWARVKPTLLPLS